MFFCSTSCWSSSRFRSVVAEAEEVDPVDPRAVDVQRRRQRGGRPDERAQVVGAAVLPPEGVDRLEEVLTGERLLAEPPRPVGRIHVPGPARDPGPRIPWDRTASSFRCSAAPSTARPPRGSDSPTAGSSRSCPGRARSRVVPSPVQTSAPPPRASSTRSRPVPDMTRRRISPRPASLTRRSSPPWR